MLFARPVPDDEEIVGREVPKIGIMVLNYNGIRWLDPLYRSLRADGYPLARVYLVDNASDDGSVEKTVSEHPDVTVISLPRNLGYCMAYNLALPYAVADGCEFLVWANNDILLEPGCLGKLAAACAGRSDIGVAGPAFKAWEGDEPNPYMTGNHPEAIPAMRAGSEVPIDVDWVEGSFLMVSRACLKKTGFLDPFLHDYWEEADFCRRARHQGYRVVLVPNAVARHFGGATWNSSSLRGHRQRLLVRNSYIYRLADPRRGFSRNLLSALHHFAVCAKAGLVSLPRLCGEIRLFARVLLEAPRIHRKWADDRAGNPPPPVTAEHAGIHAKILRAASSPLSL
jgi:GT2 family glycosyltransferase